MKPLFAALVLLAAPAAFAQHHATPERQAEVARRGAGVMPFSLAATTHVFTKTADGGIQRVVAKDGADAVQVGLVRSHLHDIAARFGAGDFSAPAEVHGAAMPGLAELRSAKPGALTVTCRDVDGGAELDYVSADPKLVAALHAWFDAQLADHGMDAMAGHHHHGHDSDAATPGSGR